ncbi:MAG: ABC transporter substrate-binding protein [Actinobacteria bacterium]|jgi:NitT/TauT family transport system substrate-binding protein|nr:MAG: ABC transporter substrate-binding protein [Actinomycetota bacterium]
MRLTRAIKTIAAIVALLLVAAACGDNKGSSASSGTLTKVKLQLQWFTQAQFAGYFAAVDQGYYKAQGLDVQIIEGGVDIVPQKVLADGQADYALAWVPKALASREAGADIVDVGQVFQRSGTLQVSFKDKNITKGADFKGKKIGNWGFGNEYEVFAAMTKAGLDPAKDVTNVQQQFDMKAMLAGEIDAAEAMTYNEYAQVLEAKNPKTGSLYTAADLNIVNYNTEGVGMLQDAIWANGPKLASDKTYQETTTKFLQASFQGWIYCRDNAQACADLVVAKGSKLGKSHQLWQMNEINKLIWPSAKGIGVLDTTAWDQTVKIAQTTKNLEGKTVLTKAPDAKAQNMTYAQKAVDALKKDKLDTEGAGFKPATVTLTEGGV